MTLTTNAPTSRHAILVLGMHRSGTSAMTGAIVEWGCAAPSHQIATNAENPKGFFESRPIARLNDALLATFEATWDDWHPLPETWWAENRYTDLQDAAKAQILADFEDAPMIALKDPRMCRLAPFWEHVLGDMGFAVHYVLPLRNPVEVALSLQTRNGFPLSHGIMLWMDHVLRAERDSRGKPRCFTSFDGLLAAPELTRRRIETHLGIHFPKPLQDGDATDPFLSRSLRHFGPDTTKKMSGVLPSLIQDLFAIFDRWAQDKENPADYPTLDHIRNQHHTLIAQAGDLAYDAPYETLFQLKGQMSEEFKQRVKAPAPLKKDLHSLVELQAHVGQVLRGQIQRQSETLQQTSEKLSQAQNAHNRDAETARLKLAELTAQLCQLEPLPSQLQAAQEAQAAVETKLCSARSALERTERQLQVSNQQLQDAQNDHDRSAKLAQSQIVTLSAQLDTLRQENHNIAILSEHREVALQAMKESTSWRITAPIRKVVTWLRRGRSQV